MDGVALLSEIHPDMGHVFDPVEQARGWHGIGATGETFAERIGSIAEQAEAKGRVLVVRSWDHIDFMPSHFNRSPSYRSKIVETLRDHFELARVSITRNPIDTWESLARHDSMRADVEAGAFAPADFMRGRRAFWESMPERARFTSVAYENFRQEPNLALAVICQELGIPYDKEWPTKWRKFRNITGCIDNTKTLGGEL
jgi:hypothetical protein